MLTKHDVTNGGFPIVCRIMIAFTLFVVAVVVVSVVGISYASGYGVSEQDLPRNNMSSVEQPTFTETDAEEADILKDTNRSDVSGLVSEIRAEEEENARIEADEKRKHEKECINRGESNKADAGNPDDGVDFSIGEDAFVETWGARIDDYLSGSALAGQGRTFAKAAFENGIDPRVSPAISNTESSKGAICFKSHNAWGWGSSSWSSWEEAIYAHVSGFAKGYGYTVTVGGAKTYCPPNWSKWYSNTTAQMALI